MYKRQEHDEDEFEEDNIINEDEDDEEGVLVANILKSHPRGGVPTDAYSHRFHRNNLSYINDDEEDYEEDDERVNIGEDESQSYDPEQEEGEDRYYVKQTASNRGHRSLSDGDVGGVPFIQHFPPYADLHGEHSGPEDEWENDDDLGYVSISLSELEFLEMEEVPYTIST